MIAWIKENFELLSMGVFGVFGAGGIIYTQKDHGRRLEDIESKEIIIDNKLTEIHGDIKTLLERTKHL